MKRAQRMRPLHVALALAVVAVWGTNFVVIRVGLDDFPPFLFALLRFAFSALPWIFLIAKPNVPWRLMMGYGVFLGAGQFGLLFYAMQSDISPGLASLVVQMQVFFTIGLSVVVFGERLNRFAIMGTLVAASGLGIIGWHLDASVTAKGVSLVLGAALCWAGANTLVKKAAADSRSGFNMLAFVIWSSVFGVPPLLLMTVLFEHVGAIQQSLANATPGAWAALAWQVIGNTFFGFAVWSWLLARYDAAAVAPYALLIPVFGMASSALWLAEPLPAWKLIAAAIVMGGVALITFSYPKTRRG